MGHLSPSTEAIRAFMQRGQTGPVDMLNLLRFRSTADYSDSPALAPEQPISGRAAYALYSRHTFPILLAAGGEVLYSGTAAAPLIGPEGERWDLVLIVRHASVEAFLSFARDPEYLKGVGHRSAALADSRLLPMAEVHRPG